MLERIGEFLYNVLIAGLFLSVFIYLVMEYKQYKLKKGDVMCFIFHKWGKWEQYEWAGVHQSYKNGEIKSSTPIIRRRQRRICQKCGKEQDELIIQ